MKNRIPVAVVAVLVMSLAQVSAWVTILQSPTNQWVSIGANVTNAVSATSTAPPLTYQWYFTNAPLLGATSRTLALPNIQLAQASEYYVVVSDADLLPVNSDLARIDVDPTFTQITTGPLVTDTAGGWYATWIDYDGDGKLDVTISPRGDALRYTAVYHNEGGGVFRKVLTNTIATTLVRNYSHVWGDYDNDGNVDLFVPNWAKMNDMLFHNNGNGSFTRITTGHPVIDGADSAHSFWGDYDRDGFIDLFLTTWIPLNDLFYRNQGDGTFRSLTVTDVGLILADAGGSDYAMWTDVDNDGFPELSRSNYDGFTWHNQLWHQDGQGQFTNMNLGALDPGSASYTGIAWADYDNDGFLDATVGTQDDMLRLYHNMVGLSFTDVTSSAFPSPVVNSIAYYPVDYDNDDWLDLLAYPFTPASPAVLYHNDGGLVFTPRDVGGPTSALSAGLFWGDYNNDGFLDVLAVYGPGIRNSLFRHNGNTNHWLKVKLDGRASNRSGIGAKVRALATIGGRTFWQMREISSQGASLDNGLIAHFGLGDATNVTTLRIEWPSGIIQELRNVATNQFLTIVESQDYLGAAPQFSGVTKGAGGLQLSFTEPAPNARYILEASGDLMNWTKLMARTSAGAVTNYTDARATNYTRRFYRLQVP